MRRPAAALVATGLAATLVATLGACDPGFEEPLPSVVAARVVDGDVEVFTGTVCTDVSEVEVVLDRSAPEPLGTLVVTADAPTSLERLRLAAPPDGFRVTTALPAGVSWRDADDASVRITSTRGDDGASVDLTELRAQDQHPGDYLVGTRWLAEDDVLAGDGDDFALLCSPDTD